LSEGISTTSVVDPIRSAWRRTTRKVILFAYDKSTFYLMTVGSLSGILEVSSSTMSHYALSGSVTRELKEISVIFPKTQVTDLLGALIE